ncbi:MAG: hypothetical protein Q9217_001239 [Psora testacea]
MSAIVGMIQPHAGKAKWKPSAENSEASRKALQDSSWADGLRGIAAVYVMFSHMTIAFARYIIPPATSENGPSYWMQRPILRLVAQGPAWVSCFIILSGFVNSLRPIKLSRAGQIDTALSNLAVSSFRRSFRLFLPALTATVLSWFICQLGAYETAKKSDAYWLSITSPQRSISWETAIGDLMRAVRNTWLFNPENPYDQPQWALLYLLLGSMITFTTLLVTINLTPRFRVGASMVAVGIFGGILLSELNYSSYPLRLAPLSPLFAPPLLIIALFLMSFPAEFQQQARWSSFLLRLHHKIFSETALVDRTWPSMGALLLCFTIVMSPHLRRALAHKWLLWLGKISFPLYLLHGSFMRSILAWLLFANESLIEMEERNGSETYIVMKYPLPSTATFVVVMPVFFVILFTATHLWAQKVEPHFGAMTKKAEDIMFGKTDGARPTVLPVRQD